MSTSCLNSNFHENLLMVLELLHAFGRITRGNICISANHLFENATRRKEKMFPAEGTN